MVKVVVKDLSRGGFHIKHHGEDLNVGEIVTIESERGTKARGQIKWFNELEAGGIFIDIPPDPDSNR